MRTSWTRVGWLLGGVLVAACNAPPTEVLVVVDSDLSVPGELDELVITVTHPDGVQTRQSTAALGAGELPLPRSLAMVHEGGPLGAYRVLVQGRRGGVVQVEREGSLAFVAQEIRVWRVFLGRACMGVDCPGTTCDGGSCRAIEVGPGELEPYVPDGDRDAGSVGMDAGGPADAGVDASIDGGLDAGPIDAGLDCTPVCEPLRTCACAGGCTCDLSCPSSGCDAACTGTGTTCSLDASGGAGGSASCAAGATCTIDASGSSGFDMECTGAGTVCDVDCSDSTGCTLRCSMGAMCSLNCAGSTACEIRPCTGGGTSCGDIEVCNRACP
ncbi:MAG: hypothetical protein KC619_22865 [Myxococcales bacterium]|nr:hypothetical protein [Myxococcales bacterium]